MSPGINKARRIRLRDVLTEKRLQKAWRGSVRPGLRNQALKDLHDYLDVHRNITSVADRIRNDVARGTYRPRESEVVTQEKRLGICRRLVIPAAADAIVLQALVDFLEPTLLGAEPTDAAYYGRSHQPPSVEDVDDSFEYVWWKLWPEFQERIWQFTTHHDYVVMTDVANYFDAIPLDRLRNHLSGLGQFQEEVLDFLFFLVEAFVWRPDYVPFSGTGLPQIDFDAPRLLAHTYLFHIDSLLQEECGTDFVRWMDDIDFGAASTSEGKALLSKIDLRLGSLGLRVNAGKSRIMTGQEALEYLWVSENRRLTLLGRLLSNAVRPPRSGPRIAAYAEKQFRLFYRKTNSGVWEKVLKRYITLFKRTSHSGFDKWAEDVLIKFPSVRPWVLDYYSEVGYHPRRFSVLKRFLFEGHCLDDVSMFRACRVLAEWHIPLTSPMRAASVQIAEDLMQREDAGLSSFAGGLWLVAKYGQPEALAAYLQKSRLLWLRSEWGGRQVAAVTPLLRASDRTVVERVIRMSGLLDALAVLADLEAIRNLTACDPQLWAYLTVPMVPYPLGKAIVAKTVLDGRLTESHEKQLRSALSAFVEDDVIRRSLDL